MKRIILCCLLTLGMMASAAAQHPTTIAVFQGTTPASLIVNGGVVYGITVQPPDTGNGVSSPGGAYGLGMVFQVKLVDKVWQVIDLHDFGPSGTEDGELPTSLLMDPTGTVLYGSTAAGGGTLDTGGTLFSLTQGSGNVWTYNGPFEGFPFSITCNPSCTGTLPLSPKNLVPVPSVPATFYFTATAGTIPPPLPPTDQPFGQIMQAPPSPPTQVHLFATQAPLDCAGRPDGQTPISLITDPLNGCGEVGIYNFNPNDNIGSPFLFNALVAYNSESLYGISTNVNGDGVIFKLTPPSQNVFGSLWTAAPIKTFGSNIGDGITPTSLVVDTDGTLYGAAGGGGSNGAGTLFSLTPTLDAATGYEYDVLYNFTTNDGVSGDFKVAAVSNGTLYGTGVSAGSAGIGIIFTFPIGTDIGVDISAPLTASVDPVNPGDIWHQLTNQGVRYLVARFPGCEGSSTAQGMQATLTTAQQLNILSDGELENLGTAVYMFLNFTSPKPGFRQILDL